jgi:arylsulfatase A-like enzyme
MERPNILFLMTDQERQPVAYETEDVRRFREEQLPTRQWLREHGVEFVHHYAGSTACSPSRPTLFTGQYPSLHTVTQTSGLAKLAGDPRLRWLRPRDVPTLGDWFRTAGYDTVYNGKWHISDEDLRGPDGRTVQTLDDGGRVFADGVAAYQRDNRLDKFGFAGWVGPEPHGPEIARSGTRADPFFAGQAAAWLDERAAQRKRGEAAAERPFLLVASFVNPHDICLWPAWVFNRPTPLSDGTVPEIGRAPTDDENLSGKPTVHRGYRRAYKEMYGPTWLMDTLYQRHIDAYRRFYHYLHKIVDAQIGRVVEALRRGPFFENTIIVFTSDHGELLGAHGGMHQKWFNMYEETVRVPLSISHAGSFGPVGRAERTVTSHVDLVPTLLALAGIDVETARATLEATHTETRPLVGRDLSAVVRGEAVPASFGDDAVYFMTEDRILEGRQQTSAIARNAPALALFLPTTYDSVRDGPTCIEGVVAYHDAPTAGSSETQRRRWKLARYFDDPEVWSHPGRYDEYRYQEPPRAGELERRTEPLPDEVELYDLDADPCEARNLAADPEYAAVREGLLGVLSRERSRKRLTRRHPVPYADVEPLPPPARRLVTLREAPAWLVRLVDRATRL